MVRSRKLALDQLEDRSVPAGDVSAILTGATLDIVGTRFSDDVLIQHVQSSPYTFNSKIVVTGRNGTTINGQESCEFIRPFPEVYYHDSLNLNVRTGNGDDRIEIQYEYSDYLGFGDHQIRIDSGSGDDIIDVSLSTIYFNTVTIPRFEIESGNGNDQVEVLLSGGFNTNLESWHIGTGNGNDTVQIHRSEFGLSINFFVDTGAGDDVIDISGMNHVWFFINGNTGNDTVRLGTVNPEYVALLGVEVIE